MIHLHKYKPEAISGEQIDSIIKLIQSKIFITSDEIKQLISNRSIIHVYYNDKNIVGVLGFKWIVSQNIVYMYVGNVVIDNEYQKCGLLSKSLVDAIVYTYLHYPLKNKFVVAFATTPQAYQYITSFKEAWPRPNAVTPTEMFNLILQYMKTIGESRYYVNQNDRSIVCNTISQIYELNPKEIKDEEVKRYFYSHVPKESKGLQLVCIAPFSIKNIFNTLKTYLIHKS